MTSTEQLDANGRPTTAYVADAAGDDAPGVVLYHAWWGLNDDVKAFADQLADAGFSVVAPDLYRGAITAEIEEAKQLTRSVDEADADAIALAAIDRLADRPNAPSRIGAVGFSFGAHWAMWSAAQRERWAPRSCTTARRVVRSSQRRGSRCRATSPQTIRSKGRTTLPPSRERCVTRGATSRSISTRPRDTGSPNRRATPTGGRRPNRPLNEPSRSCGRTFVRCNESNPEFATL